MDPQIKIGRPTYSGSETRGILIFDGEYIGSRDSEQGVTHQMAITKQNKHDGYHLHKKNLSSIPMHQFTMMKG